MGQFSNPVIDLSSLRRSRAERALEQLCLHPVVSLYRLRFIACA